MNICICICIYIYVSINVNVLVLWYGYWWLQIGISIPQLHGRDIDTSLHHLLPFGKEYCYPSPQPLVSEAT